MARPIILPEGFPEDSTIHDYGFNRPANLYGKINFWEFFDAKSGSGPYCRITVGTKGKFIVRAQEAVEQGLAEFEGPNKYFLEEGAVLKIRKV